ncbi:LLM class F420-dependent oxidoreductase [Salinibacterium sp. UTAS2018]|uniref:LLM class F420-dependent oxidoreductase n=1 Tax=Salinibacterium sp. UTAS2018 TaxID=2508880 RepID=UPI00100979B8|nr:LLM class F420-dependent oxidoreductase [Salinibacterium sp. UTAS2018]QAV69840.1 LLM class F420-dependent oxidoreductase [Salinibacterium sp. UTAS2018]
MTQSRPVRIAVQLQPQHAEYSLIRDRVKELEQLGVDILFNWDHFFPLSGEPDGLHFEAWTELASWAEMTSRVEFGTLVNCNSYRNPDLQADMARTLDHISDGRFIFGTGSGWFERDYQEYGYEFGTAGSRLDALAEALPRIESRWAKLNPAPTRKIPVLIGGGGEKKTLKLVAKHADIWHSFATGDELVHKLDVLAGHCDAVGRNINEIEISNELRNKSVEDADSMREQGITLFTLGVSGPEYDLTATKQWLAWRDAQNG